MKTSEFIKKIEELGYNVKETEHSLIVRAGFTHLAVIDKENIYGFKYFYHNDKDLFKLCVDYTSTPIEERDEDEFADEESIRIESFYNHIGERRYRIIRLETGEVHDGNGYGYKSVDRALKAYSYIRKYLS